MVLTRSPAFSIAAGYISISSAKIVFMLSGFAIYFTLPRILSPADFGNYGVTIGFMTVFNMMLIIGAIQTVSKFVSETPANERSIRRTAFRSQAMLGGCISVMLYASAPAAAGVFNDPALTVPIRIAAGVPLFYAFYAVVLGSLNGRKLYSFQAGLDMIFALIKTVFVIGGAVITAQAEGALAGFLMTSFLIMIIGIYSLQRHDASPAVVPSPFLTTRFLRFEVSVMILTLLGNLLSNMDLFMVKALLKGDEAAAMAGFFTSAQTFARIPHVLVIALAMVLFPVISSATFDNNANRSRRTIRAAMRFPLVVIAPLSIFISAFASECLAVVYPAPYAAAAPALQIMGFSVLILAMFHMGITIITGSGHPRLSITATLAGVICHATACLWLVPRFGMKGAAIGAVIGWSIGFATIGMFILRRFQTLLPVLTVLRTTSAMALTWAVVSQLSPSGLPRLIAGFIATVFLYWSLLWIIREITVGEIIHLFRRL